MSAEPKDPLAFDFGVNFKSASDRVREERTTRMEHAARAMPYHIAFLDDYLRCIMPQDLILLAAATGVGKTELARMIATQAAANGKHVHYFALEAEPLEIERRTKFTVLASIVARRQIQIPGGFTYADWYAGKLESYVASIDVEADAWVQHKYKTLHTYYRGSKFDHDDIRRLFLAIQSESDLIILDHLHYVDIDDDNENRGFKRTMKMIRDVALGMGRPVIIVAHLRKRDQARRRELVPVVEDVHGSSDIIKICTRAVLIAPAPKSAIDDVPIRAGHVGTFFTIPKDRVTGACHQIALCEFDFRSRSYADTYTLGNQRGEKFEPLGLGDAPQWAARHRSPVRNEPHWQDGQA